MDKNKQASVAIEDTCSGGSDYHPGDCESSGDEEEAIEIKEKLKEFEKKLTAEETLSPDAIFFEGSHPQSADAFNAAIVDDENETEYYDSSDNEGSFEEDGDELIRKKSKYPRFDRHAVVPTFALGMKLASKQQFKEAVINYGLAEQKVINFLKDEATRVRVQCDWAKCPWVILLSTNSRTVSWQVASFVNEHTCPPRRDNKHVTTKRITNKYEKMIKANPTWSMDSLKATVQEEMQADVSLSKCKRAKSIVMQRLLDSTKGEYSKVFDYQLELLRNNPKSTVVVYLDHDYEDPVFQRFYVCLDACKRGLLAGCRKVIGLDGCFFKGATSGELLCAIGRDFNNQMHPIA